MTRSPGLIRSLFIVLVMTGLAPAAGAQVGPLAAGAFGGMALPTGASSKVHGTGGIAGVGVAGRVGNSPVAIRAEGMFARLPGTRFEDVSFPALKMIAVIVSARIALNDGNVSPYLLAGGGVAFSHYNFNYDDYSAHGAGHVGVGARMGRRLVAPLLELRYLRAGSPGGTAAIVTLLGGFAIGHL